MIHDIGLHKNHASMKLILLVDLSSENGFCFVELIKENFSFGMEFGF